MRVQRPGIPSQSATPKPCKSGQTNLYSPQIKSHPSSQTPARTSSCCSLDRWVLSWELKAHPPSLPPSSYKLYALGSQTPSVSDNPNHSMLGRSTQSSRSRAKALSIRKPSMTSCNFALLSVCSPALLWCCPESKLVADSFYSPRRLWVVWFLCHPESGQ